MTDEQGGSSVQTAPEVSLREQGPRASLRELIMSRHVALVRDDGAVRCACDGQWYSADAWTVHRSGAFRAAASALIGLTAARGQGARGERAER